MSVTISSSVLDRIIALAAASQDGEICGLLFGAPDAIATAEPCANVAEHPARSFEIDPAALLAAHRRARHGGPAVIGHYHSHPTGNPVPSPCDAAQAMGDGAIWLIIGGRQARAWRSHAPGAFAEVAIVLI
ncbi:Mov34/MPN/PAD-1 family protein [Sphingomonas sp. STIS6.2]|uniref:Mov34/MPN/PAD-1 family protein n=1 Tax=Sphingomonas sp. STIS6.2 TaxID=1379700 RepID=UPI0004DB68CD|nr:M67 family metallopeptidase [Sphingomonas sp. STIS6.2]